jgi:hypothetical protein
MARISKSKNRDCKWDFTAPDVTIGLTIELLKSKGTEILITGRACAIG